MVLVLHELLSSTVYKGAFISIYDLSFVKESAGLVNTERQLLVRRE